MRKRLWLLPLAFTLLWAGSAAAHASGLSRGEYRRTTSGVQVELFLARPDALLAEPELDPNSDGTLAPSELQAGKPALRRLLLDGARVEQDGQRCDGELTGAALTDSDGLQLTASFACRARTAIDIRLELFRALPRGHRHLAQVRGPAASDPEILFDDHPQFRVPPLPGPGSTAPSLGRRGAVHSRQPAALEFVHLGCVHILSGVDHLAFLLALAMGTATLGALLRVITAFTVAHSLTLALVATHLVSPPASLVEPAIALSIACVALENLRSSRPRRWPISAFFGLLHGFGFAGALLDVQIPARELPAALFSFNLGVELGQLVILVPMVAILRHLQARKCWRRKGVTALSAALLVAGLLWFAARALPQLS